MKKILSLVLVCIMLLGTLPSVYAADSSNRPSPASMIKYGNIIMKLGEPYAYARGELENMPAPYKNGGVVYLPIDAIAPFLNTKFEWNVKKNTGTWFYYVNEYIFTPGKNTFVKFDPLDDSGIEYPLGGTAVRDENGTMWVPLATVAGAADLRYAELDNGEIIFFDTIGTLADNDSDRMRAIYNGRKRAYFRNGVFTGDACAVWEGGTIFKTPFPDTEDYENTAGFGVLTSIRADNSLFDIYSSKGDEVRADIVVDLADSATWRYDKLLVEDVYNILLDDGTVSKAVSGRTIGHGRKGEKVEKYFDSVNYTSNLSDTLKPGDVINVSYNIDGNIINTSSASELPVGKDPSSLMTDSSLSSIKVTNGMGDYAEFAVGEVVSIDDSYIFIEQTGGVKKAYSIKNSSVMCFNTSKNSCYDASLNDLKTREDSMVGTRVLIGDDYKIATTILFYE